MPTIDASPPHAAQANLSFARLLAVLCCLMLLGCGGPSAWPKATRIVQPAVPAYPRVATNLGTEPQGPRDGRVTRFLTGDTSEQVQAFYRLELPNSGWKHDFGANTEARVRYSNVQACPVYSLLVETTRVDAQTKVAVYISPEECRTGWRSG